MRTYFAMMLTLCAFSYGQAAKYSGPRPPKPDVPYLLHATTLVETEVTEAKQSDSKKDTTNYFVSGTASTAKTPVAEPIFIINSDKLKPDTLELYRFEVKNGRRELTLAQRRTRGGPRPLRLTVTKLEGSLYRVEAAEILENGEYSLSPSGSNEAFCFQVY